MSTIMVIYHSDTGNTEKLAECVAEGARSVAGADAKVVRADELDYNAAAKADGLAIGSPDYFSYVAGQVKTIFDKVLNDDRFKGKPFVAFGTHGGGAKVLGVIETLAKAVKFKQVAPGVLTKGAPDADGAEKARQLGKALAEAAK
jgi:flavorubredoxin